MSTEAQKRAVAKYQREKMKQINIKFSPNEYDLHEWVKRQGGTASGYVKDLIRKDMQERYAGKIVNRTLSMRCNGIELSCRLAS